MNNLKRIFYLLINGIYLFFMVLTMWGMRCETTFAEHAIKPRRKKDRMKKYD